jgi:mutator protein MutT
MPGAEQPESYGEDAGRPPVNIPRIRVAACIEKEGSLLLVEHKKEGRRYWLLPGGGVEFGETIEESLVREVREETGIAIRVGELLFVIDTIPPDRHRHIVHMVFRTDATGGELKRGEDARLSDVRYAPIARLDEYELYPDVRETLLSRLSSPGGSAQYLGNVWRD